jgi:hypothetical protein
MIVSRNIFLAILITTCMVMSIGITILTMVPPQRPAHADAARRLTQPYSAVEAKSLPKVVEPPQPQVGHGSLTPIALRPEDLGKPLMQAPYVLTLEVRIIGQAPFAGNMKRAVKEFLKGNPEYRERSSEILDDTRLCNPNEREIRTGQINICIRNRVGNNDSS